MTQQDRIAEIQVRLTFGKHSRPPGQVEDMQFLLDLLAEQRYGCPCLYVDPCSPACSCAHRGMSGGCERCCRYGSQEQRQAQAKRLAERDRQLAGG